MARRLIGTATTDSNGKAFIQYTGKGAGKLQIVAECSNVESETCDVMDCKFFDIGNSAHYTNIWSSSNAVFLRETEYTSVTEATEGTNCSCRFLSSKLIDPDGTVEFDIKQVDGSKTNGFIYIRNPTGGLNRSSFNLNAINCNVGDWIHLKVVFDGSKTYKIYVNDSTTPITRELSELDTGYVLYLYTSGSTTEFHFKNVFVY